MSATVSPALKELRRRNFQDSPQCGFGGVGTRVVYPEAAQWKKFERILEVAGRVWNGDRA